MTLNLKNQNDILNLENLNSNEIEYIFNDKIKEIKPMTGKNTITVNPEDKDAKYKRGY